MAPTELINMLLELTLWPCDEAAVYLPERCVTYCCDTVEPLFLVLVALELLSSKLGGKPFIIHSCCRPSSGVILILGSHSRHLAMKLTNYGSGTSLSLDMM